MTWLAKPKPEPEPESVKPDKPSRVVGKVAHQWGPSYADMLALISLDESPYKAVWPVRILQFFGGKRWIFGVTIYTQTPKLERQRKFRKLQKEE